MSIIWAIIIGFIVGIVAKFLMPGRDPGGFIVTTLLGIVGALLATFLGQAMGIYAAGQSAGFIGAEQGRCQRIQQHELGIAVAHRDGIAHVFHDQVQAVTILPHNFFSFTQALIIQA